MVRPRPQHVSSVSLARLSSLDLCAAGTAHRRACAGAHRVSRFESPAPVLCAGRGAASLQAKRKAALAGTKGERSTDRWWSEARAHRRRAGGCYLLRDKRGHDDGQDAQGAQDGHDGGGDDGPKRTPRARTYNGPQLPGVFATSDEWRPTRRSNTVLTLAGWLGSQRGVCSGQQLPASQLASCQTVTFQRCKKQIE